MHEAERIAVGLGRGGRTETEGSGQCDSYTRHDVPSSAHASSTPKSVASHDPSRPRAVDASPTVLMSKNRAAAASASVVYGSPSPCPWDRTSRRLQTGLA
jgi:hypothetical protein